MIPTRFWRLALTSTVLFGFLLVPVNAADATTGPDLTPTAITFDNSTLTIGNKAHFDSGVNNRGDEDAGVFNIKWLVDGKDVGAYGSHAGIPRNTLVMDGNSQFIDWTVDSPGRHTITFIVDVDNHVAESNEGNNSRSVTIQVPAHAPGNGQVPFECVTGPNGSCNGVNNPQKMAEPPHNGCTTPTGSAGAAFDFLDACNNHDHCYITHKDEQGKSATKDECDNQFLRAMIKSCATNYGAGNIASDFCTGTARLYYAGVQALGGPFYYLLAPARVWY